MHRPLSRLFLQSRRELPFQSNFLCVAARGRCDFFFFVPLHATPASVSCFHSGPTENVHLGERGLPLLWVGRGRGKVPLPFSLCVCAVHSPPPPPPGASVGRQRLGTHTPLQSLPSPASASAPTKSGETAAAAAAAVDAAIVARIHTRLQVVNAGERETRRRRRRPYAIAASTPPLRLKPGWQWLCKGFLSPSPTGFLPSLSLSLALYPLVRPLQSVPPPGLLSLRLFLPSVPVFFTHPLGLLPLPRRGSPHAYISQTAAVPSPSQYVVVQRRLCNALA